MRQEIEKLRRQNERTSRRTSPQRNDSSVVSPNNSSGRTESFDRDAQRVQQQVPPGQETQGQHSRFEQARQHGPPRGPQGQGQAQGPPQGQAQGQAQGPQDGRQSEQHFQQGPQYYQERPPSYPQGASYYQQGSPYYQQGPWYYQQGPPYEQQGPQYYQPQIMPPPNPQREVNITTALEALGSRLNSVPTLQDQQMYMQPQLTHPQQSGHNWPPPTMQNRPQMSQRTQMYETPSVMQDHRRFMHPQQQQISTAPYQPRQEHQQPPQQQQSRQVQQHPQQEHEEQSHAQ